MRNILLQLNQIIHPLQKLNWATFLENRFCLDLFNFQILYMKFLSSYIMTFNAFNFNISSCSMTIFCIVKIYYIVIVIIRKSSRLSNISKDSLRFHRESASRQHSAQVQAGQCTGTGRTVHRYRQDSAQVQIAH